MKKEISVALITGGAQGIGRGIAQYLIEKDWRVVITDQDEHAGEQCMEAFGRDGALRFVQGDVAREEDVRRVVEEAALWGGRLDALINNAAIADPDTGPPEQLELAQWQRRLDVNLTGPFLMAKHAIPHLRQSRGAIVNIASTRALQSEPHSEAYATAKGGLLALTHALAVSLGPEVRVNAVSPGWIDVRGWHADDPDSVPPLSEQDHRQHPVGRVGCPQDVAALVHYLIGPEAAFMTGQNLVLDGGMTRKMIYL